MVYYACYSSDEVLYKIITTITITTTTPTILPAMSYDYTRAINKRHLQWMFWLVQVCRKPWLIFDWRFTKLFDFVLFLYDGHDWFNIPMFISHFYKDMQVKHPYCRRGNWCHNMDQFISILTQEIRMQQSFKSQVAHRAGDYSGFGSVKRTSNNCLSPLR